MTIESDGSQFEPEAYSVEAGGDEQDHQRIDGEFLSRLVNLQLESVGQELLNHLSELRRGRLRVRRLGVDVESVLSTLLRRGYIEEVGRDPGPGQAVMYGTTREFLERLGLDSLADLPPLGDFVPAPDVVDALERGLRVSDDPAPNP